MGSTDGFKSIKIIPFDGEQDTFREWRAKTEAIGFANEWWERVVDDSLSVLKIKSDTTDPTEKETLRKEREARMYMTLACSKMAFNYIVNKKPRLKCIQRYATDTNPKRKRTT